MNTLELIERYSDEMTKSERQVSEFFLANSHDFAFFTLDRIASEAGLSTTTVIRFCRRLGFSGFKSFQNALRADIKRQPNLPEKYQRTMDWTVNDELLSQTLQMNILCLQQTFQSIPSESLAAAVRYIIDAKRVFTFGMKESFALAHYAYTRLLTVRSELYILNAGYNGEVEPILNLTPQDVCIVYAFHRYTRQTLQILPLLKKQGAVVILITSEPYDRVEPYATLLLPCHVDAKGIKNTAIAPICLADYLCSAVALQSGEAALEHMRALEELFKTKSILES